MKTKKFFSAVITLVIFATLFGLSAYAATGAQLTSRVEVVHQGTEGSAYSSEFAVNSTAYDYPRFSYTATVTNRPGKETRNGVYVTGKVLQKNKVLSTPVNRAPTSVGNTTSNSTVEKLIDGGNKDFGENMNNMYRLYINIEGCPPGYMFYTDFDFGGIFYGRYY